MVFISQSLVLCGSGPRSTSEACTSQHQGCSDKYVFISVREEGEYTQHGRNATAPYCTLPCLETDKINPTDSRLVLLLLCFCSG